MWTGKTGDLEWEKRMIWNGKTGDLERENGTKKTEQQKQNGKTERKNEWFGTEKNGGFEMGVSPIYILLNWQLSNGILMIMT